jgi:hypothetical protein
MSQHDLTVDNAAGGVFRGDLNNALRALASFNSGSTPPPTMVGGMPWLDMSTTPAILKFRNEANSAWLSMGSLQDLAGILTAIAGISSKAPLASPALTGTPTAPTAPAGTNTTQLANTAFVTTALSTAITNLVNASPAALDTLKELATAMGNDPNFATTVTNSLAGKAPLTGAGTSGTWPISISGSAGNASTVTTLTTTQTLNATAGASAGAVGTYALCYNVSAVYLTPNTNVSASNLYYANSFGEIISSLRPSGTWKIMAFSSTSIDWNSQLTSLYLRIA